MNIPRKAKRKEEFWITEIDRKVGEEIFQDVRHMGDGRGRMGKILEIMERSEKWKYQRVKVETWD